MKKDTLALPALILVAMAILGLRFGSVIAEPNSYLFSLSEDAVKSYYNFSWYLDYGHGIRHDGINYPYGDHLQYINSHPLYVQVLKMAGHFLPVSGKGVGILNLTMIFSLLAAVPFIYLILRKFSMPPWYSAVVALIILLLSPQIDRMGGHFEMAYAFFIPLYWYLLIRWHEGRRRWLWTLLLLLTSLTGGFTSAYYAAFLALFPVAVLLVQIWNHRKKLTAYLPEGLYLLAIACVPLLIVKGFVVLTDWVDDRPDNPWGFFIFHSNMCSIFLPSLSPLRTFLGHWFDLSYQWEGKAYVGFPASLLMPVVLVSSAYALAVSLFYVLTRGKRKSKPFFLRKDPVNLYLVAAVIILLFAMCIPFRWAPSLADLLPPVRQFRCLGRFSWIFYYVFTAYTAIVIYRSYRLLRRKRSAIAAYSMIILLLAAWGYEAGINFKNHTRNLFNRNTLITRTPDDTGSALLNAGYTSGDFQAILCLPFASSCGDKLLFTRGMHAFAKAMHCGYQTGIPLIESFSPRLSFSQAMSSIQLLADSTIYKTRVDDMNNRPVLLVVTHEELDRQEQRIAALADFFWEGDDFSLGRLPVKAFNEGFAAWVDTVRNLTERLPYRKGSLRTNVPASGILYDDYENKPSVRSFTGHRARSLRMGEMELFKEDLHQEYGEIPLEFSFWLYVDHRKHNMPTPVLRKLDGQGNPLGAEKLDSRAVHNVDGLWVRIAHQFKAEPGIIYQLAVTGEYITVDDLLLKPDSAEVAVVRDSVLLLFDNFRVPVAPLD